MVAIACLILIVICGYFFLMKCLASLACVAAVCYLPGVEKTGALVALVWNVFWAVVWCSAINFLFHLP